MRRADRHTRDLFEVPSPAPELPGMLDFRPQIASIVSEMTRAADIDRYEISSRVSRLVGRDVSKNMLDAYASELREDHNLPLYIVPALESVCSSHLLSGWLADVRGGRLLIGRDALLSELGRLERSRDDAAAKIKRLKAQMGDVGHA
ncbi:conserved hypothetical protein [Thiomonas sp. CB3]|nr:conserved hypothetical protein [Thiomonas sp. CB3]